MYLFSKMAMDRTVVFLDGGYLSKISKYFGKGRPYKVDLKQFAITLDKEKDLWCLHTYFYIAPPYQSPTPTKEETIRKANHDHWISKLDRINDFTVRQGRCQKCGINDYQQKGVDTLITMDLSKLPLEHKGIQKIIILACDTDFVPILNELRRKNHLHVILAFFSDRVRNSEFSMSNHILTACDEKVLLTKEHFEKSKYIPNKKDKK